MKNENLLLRKLIREEINKELKEAYDLDNVKYPASIQKQVDSLVDAIQKSGSNLSKPAIAAILNDIILGLGLNKAQMTMYMNMIRKQRQKFEF